MAQAARKEVKISDLPPQQLSSLKEQLEGELEGLAQSAMTLQNVATEFHKSGESIEELKGKKEGAPMLLPLSQSLYVEGELANADHVLLDIGTGYYVEKPLAGGVDYCKRKVNQMGDNLKEINKVRSQKGSILMQVDKVLQQKMRAAAAQEQTAAQAAAAAVDS